MPLASRKVILRPPHLKATDHNSAHHRLVSYEGLRGPCARVGFQPDGRGLFRMHPPTRGACPPSRMPAQMGLSPGALARTGCLMAFPGFGLTLDRLLPPRDGFRWALVPLARGPVCGTFSSFSFLGPPLLNIIHLNYIKKEVLASFSID